MAEAASPNDAQKKDLPKNTVAVKDAGTLKKKVTVTIPQAAIDAKREEMFGELGQSAQVPGFRIGRAPRRLIEKRFSKEVSSDVRNALIGESIGDAIEQADLKTLGEPDLKLDDIELPDSGEMTFDFEVEVSPEFELPDTGNIKVQRQALEVNDKRVDEYIQNLLQGKARYEKTDDAAEDGDGITAAAKITGDDVEHENPRLQLRVAPGVVEGLAIADLAKDLKGKKVGNVVTLKTTAPETHPNEGWRNKELTIELTVHEVMHRVLPEMDEEFAKGMGFDSLKEMREFVAVQLKSSLEQESQRAMRDQICQHLLDNTKFDLPEGVVARHVYQTMQRQAVELLQHGVPREKIQERQAQLQASAKEQATRSLKLTFILDKIAEQEEIDVNDTQINARIAQIAAQYRRRPERLRQELTADGRLEQISVSIREEKALDKLLENAKIEDVKGGESKAVKKTAEKSKTKTTKKSSDSETREKKTKAAKKPAAKKTTTKKAAAKKTAKKKSGEKK